MFEAGELLIIAGSLVFLAGAAFGVPSVFMTSSIEERARLLSAHATRWRLAQLPYGLGPIVAALGVTLTAASTERGGRLLRGAAGISLLLGATAWAYSCRLRASDPLAFAEGHLPAWPFHSYIASTLIGLALFGAALLLADTSPAWLGWTVLSADAAFVAGYAATSDIPPFVFYVLLLIAGLAL